MAKDNAATSKAAPEPASGSAAAPSFCPDCRAKRMSGIDAFTECLTQAPGNCRFLFIYGHGHFCTHPLRERIVQQTETQRCPV